MLLNNHFTNNVAAMQEMTYLPLLTKCESKYTFFLNLIHILLTVVTTKHKVLKFFFQIMLWYTRESGSLFTL